MPARFPHAAGTATQPVPKLPRATRRERRCSRRRGSTVAADPIERCPNLFARHEPRRRGIQIRPVGLPQADVSRPSQACQRLFPTLATGVRRHQTSHDHAASGYRQRLAILSGAQVFAEPVLEGPNPHGLHSTNVAPLWPPRQLQTVGNGPSCRATTVVRFRGLLRVPDDAPLGVLALFVPRRYAKTASSFPRPCRKTSHSDLPASPAKIVGDSEILDISSRMNATMSFIPTVWRRVGEPTRPAPAARRTPGTTASAARSSAPDPPASPATARASRTSAARRRAPGRAPPESPTPRR